MAATGHHPPASNPKRPCWFYGKISGCRYGNGCKYDHSISKTSIYGKLFGILGEILKNQNAIYKAIQQTQNIQFPPYNSSTGDIKEEDIQPHQVPRRKTRSKRGKSPPFAAKNPSNSIPSSDDDDSVSTSPPPLLRPKQKQKKQQNVRGHPCRETAAMDSGTVCDSEHCVCIEPQRTAVHYPVVPQRKEPQTTASTAVQRPVISQHKHTPQKKKKSPQHPSRLNPYARAYPNDECKDISISKKTNLPPQVLQILQKRLSHSPPTIKRSIEGDRTQQTTAKPPYPRQPRQPRYPRQLSPNTKPIEHTNPQHPPPRSKTQCTASKVQKSRRNTTKHPKQHSTSKQNDSVPKQKQRIYRLDDYRKQAKILITADTEEDLKQIITTYDEYCSTSPYGGIRINKQLHPNSFVRFVIQSTLIDGNYSEEYMDIDKYFEMKYPSYGYHVPPISSDTTFAHLINETFRKLDDAKINYNDTALFPSYS